MKTSGKKNLNKGNPGNKGGGRKPDWLKAKCAKIIEDNALIEFLGDVASGENVEAVVSIDGKNSLKVPAKVKDRLAATEMLLDRGFGKVPQVVADVTPQDEAGQEALRSKVRGYLGL